MPSLYRCDHPAIIMTTHTYGSWDSVSVGDDMAGAILTALDAVNQHSGCAITLLIGNLAILSYPLLRVCQTSPSPRREAGGYSTAAG